MSRAEDEADDRWSEGERCVGGVCYTAAGKPTGWRDITTSADEEALDAAWRRMFPENLTPPMNKRLPE